MLISLSTILNTSVWSSLLILILLIVLRRPERLPSFSLPIVLSSSIIICLRILLPVEFFFTQTIGLKKILPQLYMVLRRPLFEFDSWTLRFFHILGALWFIGSIIRFIRMAKSYRKLRHQISKLKNVTEQNILAMVDSVNGKFKKPVHFSLAYSQNAVSPFITGFKNPVIVLSNYIKEEDKIQYVIIHELYHFYKGHLWIKFFLECIRNIYFWNPLIYILIEQLNNILELDVDKTMTSTYSEQKKIEYAECLLSISRQQYESKMKNLPGIAFTTTQNSGLRQRIYYLTEPPKRQWTRIHSFLFYGMLFLLISLSLFFIFEPTLIPREVEETTIKLTNENAYFIKTGDETYDLYYEGVYSCTVTEVFDSTIPIKEIDKQ